MPEELASGQQRRAGSGWVQPEAKWARSTTTYHQAVDLRTLFDGSRINPGEAPRPGEVCTKGVLYEFMSYTGKIRGVGAHYSALISALYCIVQGGCG